MSNENRKWIFFSLLNDPDRFAAKRNSKIRLWKGLIYAFFKLHLIFALQLPFLLRREKQISQYIILGSQASHHHLNIFRFLNFNPNKATIINAYDKTSFTSIRYIGIISLYKEFRKKIFELKDYLINDNKLYNSKDLITHATESIASFTYFSLLFQSIKSSHPNINIYSGGAELASLAAINSSLNTHYISHGLLGLKGPPDGSLSEYVEDKISEENYPAYSSIYVYSDYENKFFSSRLTNTKVVTYPVKTLIDLNPVIILFFEITDEFFDLKRFQQVVKFFKKNNFQIIAKEHPANQSEFPVQFCRENQIELIRGSGITAYEIIREKQPMFTLGWPSTSLCESLNLGVIPICIPDHHPFFRFQNFYPFQSKTLSWSKDLLEIERLLFSQQNYDSRLADLRKNL
jgi:hypothetical protein